MARAPLLLVLAACGADDEGPPEPTTIVEETDLGDVTTGDGEALALDVPDDAISATWVFESDAGAVLAADVVSPDGAALLSAADPVGSLNPALSLPRAFAVLVPDTPRVALAPGRYEVTPRSVGAPADVRVRAYVKRPDPALGEAAGNDTGEAGGLTGEAGGDDTGEAGGLDTQVLPIQLWFTTPGLGPDDARVDQALGRMEDLLALGGLAAGPVEARELDVPDEERFLSLDESGDSAALWSLLARSAGAEREGINLFFVEDIEAEGTGLVLVGVSGAIPVPPARGTVRSGVAVSVLVLRQAPDLTGLIMAHEVGHALGLFHTTEREIDPWIADPLDDTPPCPPEADADGDGALTYSECAGLDADNLMFPVAEPASRADLTPDQGWVLRRNALAR